MNTKSHADEKGRSQPQQSQSSKFDAQWGQVGISAVSAARGLKTERKVVRHDPQQSGVMSFEPDSD